MDVKSALICTDSHNYLYYDSAHPQRCKDSIPYSQFLRIRHICTHNKDFDNNVIELSKHFLRRKYPLELILQAAFLARSLDRSELLSPTDTEKEDEGEKVLLGTRNNWAILGRNQTTETLYKRKLMCGFRRPPNLRNHLCKARVPRLQGDERCGLQYVSPPLEVTNHSRPRVLKQTSMLDFARPPTMDESRENFV